MSLESWEEMRVSKIQANWMVKKQQLRFVLVLGFSLIFCPV